MEVRRYTRSILLGLTHIHKKGYVHCDLKPDNILLINNSSDGFTAKIGDLGLTKQSKKNKLEPPSDVWAVGCIVFEMLTGKPLWFSEKDLTVDEILSRISDENELPWPSRNKGTAPGRAYSGRRLTTRRQPLTSGFPPVNLGASKQPTFISGKTMASQPPHRPLPSFIVGLPHQPLLCEDHQYSILRACLWKAKGAHGVNFRE
ncbi:hypothetical protein L1887_22477 [Cichorium endivia]|nr:hypothetical protein L1887_22477 [Cichorium endivia]